MTSGARKKTNKPDHGWLAQLTQLVHRRPLVIFRFGEDEWEGLRHSRRGFSDFTMARAHALLDDVRTPTACLLIGTDIYGDTEICFGLLESRSAVTTLDTRLKITAAQAIEPSSEAALLECVKEKALQTNFRGRLKSKDAVVRLSPALSSNLVQELSRIEGNRRAMRSVVASLDAPTTYSSNEALQEDAIHLALKAFGLAPGDLAASVSATGDKDTALARVSVREDAVIEHDARSMPGFSLASSDVTGRATFRKGNELLEVITANHRPLEEVLGVDLIYLNALKQNVVMIQYKMLKPDRHREETDWIYRPDSQLAKEMERMQLFSRTHEPGPLEYRINPQVFYLRFVRRDAMLAKSTITMPVDHFEVLRKDPQCKGSRGAFRISFDALDGKYLRQDGFLHLVRCGYIGAYAKTTSDLTALINAVLKDGHAVVAAVHASLPRQP